MWRPWWIVLAVVAVVAVVAVCPRARADDKAAAEAAFERAKQLEKAGDYAGACPLYEASYRADPALGALLNLANCHEHIGRTATAWAEFRQAEELARTQGDDRAAYARTRIDALAPRLSKLRIDKPASEIPGLVVRRDDTVATLLLGVETPVDPGDHVIAASAPGYQPWQLTLHVEGATVTVAAIPALGPVPAEPPAAAAPTAPPVATTAAAVVAAPRAAHRELRLLAGTSFDGFAASPTFMDGAGPAGSGKGIRFTPGVYLGVRTRFPLTPSTSFEPGVAIRFRRLYLESCAPCRNVGQLNMLELEAPLLFRVGLGHGHTQPVVLGGGFVTLRPKLDENADVQGEATGDASPFDVGLCAGFGLDVGHVGAQLLYERGFRKISREANAPINGVSLTVVIGL